MVAGTPRDNAFAKGEQLLLVGSTRCMQIARGRWAQDVIYGAAREPDSDQARPSWQNSLASIVAPSTL